MKLHEDYCSFELSKLLKEKGFDEECDWFYEEVGDLNRRTRNGCDKYINSLLDYGEYAASTHQMAMKWLREMHRKYIDIRYNNQNEEYRFIVFTMVKDKPIDFIHSEYHSTYEEAVEAALKYVLENLI